MPVMDAIASPRLIDAPKSYSAEENGGQWEFLDARQTLTDPNHERF